MRFEDPSAASDLYALGMVAAAMLLGARPDRVDPAAVPVGCPPALWALVAELIAEEPAARPGLDDVADRLAAPELAWVPGAAEGIEVFRQVDALGTGDATVADTLVEAPAAAVAIAPAEARTYPVLLIASALAVVVGIVLLVLSFAP